ncbi:MAG: hypothetical protein AAF467_00560 [Actinomycetota bacterium]
MDSPHHDEPPWIPPSDGGAPAEEAAAPPSRWVWLTPAFAVVTLFLALYAQSVPGIIDGAVALWFVFTPAVFCTWFVGLVIRGARNVDVPLARLRSVITLGALLLAFGVMMTEGYGLPLDARFRVVQGSFDSYLATLEPALAEGEQVELDPPRGLGGFDVTGGFRFGDNVVLYEANSDWFGNAGFAHLPGGPDAATGEYRWTEYTPTFRHLDGDWYAWTTLGW